MLPPGRPNRIDVALDGRRLVADAGLILRATDNLFVDGAGFSQTSLDMKVAVSYPE